MMRVLLKVLTPFLSVITVIIFFASWDWRFEVLSHFSPQIFTASLFALILSFLYGYSRLAIILGFCALIQAYTFNDSLIIQNTESKESLEGQTSSLRILTLNMHGSGTHITTLKERIRYENPTVLTLTELPQDHTPLLEALKYNYPYSIFEREDSPFDVVVFSKWPIKKWRIERNTRFMPLLIADLCTTENDERCISLIALHSPRPLSESGAQLQKKMLRRVTQIIQEDGEKPVIVVGDLNTTPWSPTFTFLLRNAHLYNSANGFKHQSTWRSRNPLFGLHIDHILINHYITARQWWVDDTVGSDHYPVFADLTVKWPMGSSQEPLITRHKPPVEEALPTP